MRSLKEKLDSKKNEQVKFEHRGILIIIMQEKKKDLERKTEILKRVANLPFDWLEFIGVFQHGKKEVGMHKINGE